MSTSSVVKRKVGKQLVLKFKPGTGNVSSKNISKSKPADPNDPDPLVAALAQLNAVENIPANPRTQRQINQFEKNCELTRGNKLFYNKIS